MSADIIVWPECLLVPENSRVNIVPFTRSGGRSLGGLARATRTDRGWWTIDLERIMVDTQERRRTWEAIAAKLGGRAGLVAVPAWSFDTAPYADGVNHRGRSIAVPHSDGATFSDGSQYRQPRIDVQMADEVPIGATSCRLRIIDAEPNLVGIRFSYEHALYKTGPAVLVDGDYWTVPITPSCRAPIPAGAELELDMPTCLCHLADDRGMDLSLNSAAIDTPTVSFNEAVDYWNDLAVSS